MDLILSLSIEKIGSSAEKQRSEPVEMDWLQNANADLMKFFHASETEEKIAEITEVNAIKIDHLDIGYEDGQYYVLDQDTRHPLNDNDRVHLPGYIVTVHIRNNAQAELLHVDTRYSKQLVDFDNLLIASDSLLPNTHQNSVFDHQGNSLGYYFDLPNMVVEGEASPRHSIEHDRESFHRPQKPVQEGNILETLGIYDSSDYFLKKGEMHHAMANIQTSASFHHLDEIYDETHRAALENHQSLRTTSQLDDEVKPNFRKRLIYFKKALIGE